jgi:Lrp/AsnC family transcriptional regulator, regulator for asnA, asnC and gidA
MGRVPPHIGVEMTTLYAPPVVDLSDGDVDAVNRPRLDDIDRRLVLALQRDGRASYARLADEVAMSQATVRTRVQRLLESGVVQIAAVADPFAFGFNITAMVGITYTGDLRVMADVVKCMRQVHFVVLTAGRYDCLAEVVCVDTDDLLSLVNDQIRTIPGVKDVEVITYLQMVKQWQPEYLRDVESDERKTVFTDE